jgi:nitrogen fixation NifU-like protein
MSDLRELYQEVILDHSKRPRNFGHPAAANRQADGHNPLCGDRVRVYLVIADGIIRDAAFEGDGCAISKASASLMTEAVKGRSEAEVRELFARFHDLVTGEGEVVEELDRLAVFAGVHEFPVRVKCATLPWHTLVAALEGARQPVKTE